MATDPELTVTPETFIRAETDRYFANLVAQAGGVNRLYHFRQVTPLDRQTVVRMNKDTLYSMGIVDTAGGAHVTFPALPDDRYASVYLCDNDHYVPFVIYDPGVHELPSDTRYLALGVRIQLFDPDDPTEVALVNRLQEGFRIDANSAARFEPPSWDRPSLDQLRSEYERQFATVDRYPDEWQGRRGEVDENTRHLAAAGAWGLFPNRDATYINDNPRLSASGCFTATYEIPDNDAFWSMTVYGGDGYMKHDNNIVSSTNVALNADGTFTVTYGRVEHCGDRANRVDIADGWNVLMRIYRPGTTVLDGTYQLAAITGT